MEYQRLYDLIKPDEHLTVREVYGRSKKDDDFEKNSTRYTYHYTVSRIGKPSERELKVIKIRNKRITICKRIWRGIKVSFFVNPGSSLFETYLNSIKRLLELRVQELNEEFLRKQDADVLKCPNPSQDQLLILQTINRLLRIAMGQS